MLLLTLIIKYNFYINLYLSFFFSFRKMFGETNNVLFSKTSPKHPKLSLPKMAVSLGSSSILGPPEV